jgi:ferritin-like metal-binding protein YciE
MAQIGDPKQLFEHELGMGLGAERKVLTTLRTLERSAQRRELKQQFHHHLEETEGQIKNLEQAFQALGARAGGHEADSANGIAAEGEKLMEKVDEKLIDAVLLGAAAKTEHVEIAMYEGLLTQAEAMGAEEVVALLEENLEQEKQTLEDVKQAAEKRQSDAHGVRLPPHTSTAVAGPSFARLRQRVRRRSSVRVSRSQTSQRGCVLKSRSRRRTPAASTWRTPRSMYRSPSFPEQRRQDGQRADERGEDDQHRADPDRGKNLRAREQHPSHRDQDGKAGDQHRPTRGCGRAVEGLVACMPGGAVLPLALQVEERVVDADRHPHQQHYRLGPHRRHARSG